jgi:hypothetical protein
MGKSPKLQCLLEMYRRLPGGGDRESRFFMAQAYRHGKRTGLHRLQEMRPDLPPGGIQRKFTGSPEKRLITFYQINEKRRDKS